MPDLINQQAKKFNFLLEKTVGIGGQLIDQWTQTVINLLTRINGPSTVITLKSNSYLLLRAMAEE